MPTVSNLPLTSTNAREFRANGQAANFRYWLRQRRPDMSWEAVRQVAHYAAKLIDILGADAPRILTEAPHELNDCIAAYAAYRGMRRRSLARQLERAGLALHAAIHDLDAEATRRCMDRRTTRRGRGRQLNYAYDRPQPAADLFQAKTTEATRRAEIVDGTAANPKMKLPVEVRSVLEAVNHQVTAQVHLDDRLDVRTVARSVLANLSPEARVRVAAGLPHAARLPVTTGRPKAANTLSELAEEAIVALLEQRYADLRLA